MKYTGILLSIITASFITACSDSNFDFDKSREDAENAAAQLPSSNFQAEFDPANQIIPFPNNLLFSNTQDGTINITVADETDFSNPQVALNALDGFSTTAPITASFSQPINADTAILGDTVRIFEVSTDPATGAVTGVVSELAANTVAVAVAGAEKDTMVILPVSPLTESTTYLVVLTKGISNTADPASAADKSISYYLTSGDTELTGALAALEPVRQLTATFEAAAVSQGVTKSDIVLSWTFTTQSITPVMDAVVAKSAAGNVVVGPQGTPTSAFNPALTGAAEVFFGALTVPYYQTAPTAENPALGVNGFWKAENGGFVTRFNPIPVATSDQTIPLLITVPSIEDLLPPPDGWPVAIYQHGITRDRSDMLAVAESLAAGGIAVIAIDSPMHGITDKQSPLYAGSDALKALGANERTFDLDLANNETRAPGPDGIIDSSGTHFYNLSNLLNARDNLRQAISDLATLRKSIAGITTISLNADQVSFVGHSLGGIMGAVFLANDDVVGPATLAMPGAGLSRLLANSPSFGPIINAGLADQGAPEGSVEYESFLTVAQTVIDSGDPVNFSKTAAAKHPIHLLEVVGGSAGSLSDQVIPNAVLTAPLSGTEPMIRLMGLDTLVATTGDGSAPVSGVVKFISGDHGSIISPTADPLVTQEMQTEMVKFLASRGTIIEINNTSVIDTGN